jgi:ABC-2 type transport system permease protein
MKIHSIFKREVRAYFVSPVAYVILAIFLIITGFFFYNMLMYFNLRSMQMAQYPYMDRGMSLNEMVMRPLFQNMSVIILLFIPMLTMRLYAEEKKSGTIELLFTAPLSDAETAIGKFLAAFFMFFLMSGLTLLYPFILSRVSTIEWGPVWSGYIGFLLMGGAFISIGLLISAFTSNQIVASLLTFGILLFFWIIGWSSEFATGIFSKVLSYLSLIEHFDDFAKGVCDTTDIVYYLSFIFFGLFATVQVLESSKWRA